VRERRKRPRRGPPRRRAARCRAGRRPTRAGPRGRARRPPRRPRDRPPVGTSAPAGGHDLRQCGRGHRAARRQELAQFQRVDGVGLRVAAVGHEQNVRGAQIRRHLRIRHAGQHADPRVGVERVGRGRPPPDEREMPRRVGVEDGAEQLGVDPFVVQSGAHQEGRRQAAQGCRTRPAGGEEADVDPVRQGEQRQAGASPSLTEGGRGHHQAVDPGEQLLLHRPNGPAGVPRPGLEVVDAVVDRGALPEVPHEAAGVRHGRHQHRPVEAERREAPPQQADEQSVVARRAGGVAVERVHRRGVPDEPGGRLAPGRLRRGRIRRNPAAHLLQNPARIVGRQAGRPQADRLHPQHPGPRRHPSEEVLRRRRMASPVVREHDEVHHDRYPAHNLIV
jgi:hypothetical protein